MSLIIDHPRNFKRAKRDKDGMAELIADEKDADFMTLTDLRAALAKRKARRDTARG